MRPDRSTSRLKKWASPMPTNVTRGHGSRIRGNNDQRVRPQIDWGIITDEDPAHASDVVMNAARVDASHVKAKSR